MCRACLSFSVLGVPCGSWFFPCASLESSRLQTFPCLSLYSGEEKHQPLCQPFKEKTKPSPGLDEVVCPFPESVPVAGGMRLSHRLIPVTCSSRGISPGSSETQLLQGKLLSCPKKGKEMPSCQKEIAHSTEQT